MLLTPGRQGGLLLDLGRLAAPGWDVVVDAFVVVVHSHRQHLLSVGLAHHVFVQVGINLRGRQCDKTFLLTSAIFNLRG